MDFLAALHPKIVHFPIVLFITYFVLETAGTILKKDYLNKMAFYFLSAGILFALLAVLSGNQASTAAHQILKTKNPGVMQLVEKHELYATITLWYFFALLVFRFYLELKNKFSFKMKLLFIMLGLLGSYLIFQSGLLGGELVFNYGIGTKLFR